MPKVSKIVSSRGRTRNKAWIYLNPSYYFHNTTGPLKTKKLKFVSAESHVVHADVKIYRVILLLYACLSYAEL